MPNFPFHSETQNNYYKQSRDHIFCHTLHRTLPSESLATTFA